MENNKTDSESKNSFDPNNPDTNDVTPDPSNTSHIGQKVEQGIISKEDGITAQSSKWEESQEKNPAGDPLIDEKAERYIKSPSPEENKAEPDAEELTGGKNNAGKPNTPENNPAL
jgi:hypothetical protein